MERMQGTAVQVVIRWRFPGSLPAQNLWVGCGRVGNSSFSVPLLMKLWGCAVFCSQQATQNGPRVCAFMASRDQLEGGRCVPSKV
jgi:hypothetical protein